MPYIYRYNISMKNFTKWFSFVVLIIGALSLSSCANFETVNSTVVDSQTSQQKNNDNIKNYGEETSNLVFTISTISKTSTSLSVSVSVKASDNIVGGYNNFYVGYYEEANYQYPAKLIYDLTYSNGEKVTQSTNIIKKNTNGNYDGIGDYLGTTSLSTFCDISCPSGTTIDTSTIKLVNVFAADIQKDTNGTIISRLPIYDHPYYVSATLSSTFKNYDFDDFMSLRYAGKTSFSGFTSLKFNTTCDGVEMYKQLKPSAYSKYQTQIESGAYYVRTRLSFSGDSKYLFTTNEDTILTQSTISSNIDLSAQNDACYFLIKDIDFKNVKNFEFYNVYLNLGIYNRSAYKEVSGSNIALAIRFNTLDLGFVDVFDGSGNIAVAKSTGMYDVDANLILIFTALIFALVFIGIDLGMYFYLKNKYKNDEFKHMKTGQYFKTSLIAFICIGSFIFATLTIIFRGNFLNNAFAVYNPLDVYVIIFSVVAAILFGYFVRYFWINFKASQEKRNNEKLKLNQSVIDDGTLLTEKE